jgi:uncharacterized spore protein YtfJ
VILISCVSDSISVIVSIETKQTMKSGSGGQNHMSKNLGGGGGGGAGSLVPPLVLMHIIIFSISMLINGGPRVHGRGSSLLAHFSFHILTMLVPVRLLACF